MNNDNNVSRTQSKDYDKHTDEMNQPKQLDKDKSHALMNKVLCPALRIGINLGRLTPDQDGWIERSELQEFVRYLGWKEKSIIQHVINLSISDDGPRIDAINIAEFKGSSFDHGSTSGILNNWSDPIQSGFYPDRLRHMMTFSNSNGDFSYMELAHAAQDFYRNAINKKSLKGLIIVLLEYSNILALFGTKDKRGTQVLSADDITRIWQYARPPKGWKAPQSPFYGTGTTVFNALRMSVLLLYVSIVKPHK